jgi:diguanylate cyclase (GGDEF)-like protein
MSKQVKLAFARLGREQTILVVVVLAYLITGKIGLSLGISNPATSFIFAPPGIALGAYLVLGYKVWPAILLAAGLLYAAVLGPEVPVLILACGNAGEGLLASYLINRYAEGRHALQNPRNTARFAGVTVVTCAIVGATVGSLTLVLFGRALWSDLGVIWMEWSIGSVAGCLIVTPLVMLLSQGSFGRWKPAPIVEGVFVFVAIVFVGSVVFLRIPASIPADPINLLCVPALLWGAFRLGRLASTMGVLTVTGIAVYGTLARIGPFYRVDDFTYSLAMLMGFMSLTSVMTLSLAALASEYHVAENQLRELVVTDPLTGLPNYRRLVEVLGAEIHRSNRSDKAFAVVFFDMDGLKRINDELGHLIGSRALCRFADTLKAACRGTDIAARYGGDEFVAVLPDTTEEGAQLVITRLNERLAEDNDKPEITVSAGIAMYPRDGGTPTTLLSAADRALYSVKAEKALARRRGVVPIREWSNASSR